MQGKVKCLLKFFSKPLFAFGLFALCSFPNLANSSQNAVVTTDGAIVYKQPNFDSAILGYFRSGQSVRISNKTFGPFYRVRFKQGLVGYISDIDINPKGGGSAGGKRTGKTAGKEKTTVVSQGSSSITKTYVGLSVGMINWSELVKVGGPAQQFSDSLIFYGGKGSFPMGSWLSGPFTLDVSALVSFKAPNYFSTYNPTALIAIGQAGIFYTMAEFNRRKIPVYLGGSLGVTYESIKLNVSGQAFDLTEIIMGGSFTVGAGYMFSNMIFKLEASYFITKSTYLGIIGSLQWQM